MKNVTLIALLLFLTSFVKGNYPGKEDSLSFIRFGDTLRFEHENAKCGEWGGDIEVILIYRGNFTDKIWAVYTKIIMNCDGEDIDNPGKEQFPKVHKRVSIGLDEQQLVKQCIEEIIDNRLKRKPQFTAAGIRNVISLNDCSLIIKDYPSIEWKQFEILRDKLLIK